MASYGGNVGFVHDFYPVFSNQISSTDPHQLVAHLDTVVTVQVDTPLLEALALHPTNLLCLKELTHS
jgi:hypothetical protein